jgi:beta-phosphoglucomutase-like phosphatase (HAD superfamily)
MRIEPVFLFDLDGTPVDSVYQHALAWKAALDAEGIELSISSGPGFEALVRPPSRLIKSTSSTEISSGEVSKKKL